MSQLTERLSYALEQAGISRAELARKAELTQQNISNILLDKQKSLSALTAVKIATALGISTDWLITGKGLMKTGLISVESPVTADPQYVEIKEHEISFSCGGLDKMQTEPSIEEVQDSIPVTYRLDFFEKAGINWKECKRFKAVGDSMAPLIQDGDHILVDTSEQARHTIRNGDIYAIYYEGALFCKYLTKTFKNELIIGSENPKYKDEILDLKVENNQFYIIGRVLERSGKLIN